MLSRCLILFAAVWAFVSPAARAEARGQRSVASQPGVNAFRAPMAGVTLIGGSTVEARWSVSPGALGDADEAELVLLLDGGPVSVVRLSAELSPRDASYRFRVPSLATTNARLALRVGSQGETVGERLVLIGAAFAIASEAGAPEGLAKGSGEWWTEQALFEQTVRDLLQESVKDGRERLVAPRGETEADLPSVTEVPGPGSASNRIAVSASSIFCSPPAAASASSVSGPLRL